MIIIYFLYLCEYCCFVGGCNMRFKIGEGGVVVGDVVGDIGFLGVVCVVKMSILVMK